MTIGLRGGPSPAGILEFLHANPSVYEPSRSFGENTSRVLDYAGSPSFSSIIPLVFFLFSFYV